MTGRFVSFGHREPWVGWIIQDDGCHIWTGYKSPQGYGRVYADGRRAMAHRVRYEREVGPIPEGAHMDHFACDNPSCCNPEHVRPVTPRENVLRGDTITSRNRAKTHCKYGHRLAGKNLVPNRKAAGERRCRKCHNERARQRMREQRAERRNEPVLEGPSLGANAEKTHCPAGHPLEGDNLLSYELKQGRRKCRTCKNAQAREAWAARNP